MGRQKSAESSSPDLDRQEREAEVRVKTARADKEEAAAHQKRKEAGLDSQDPDLDDKLAGGIVRDKFADISRKLPGGQLWSFWKKHLPVDEIESIEEYIQAEGDPRYEHKVVMKDDKGKPLKKPVFFPALDADPGAASLPEVERELKEVERKLKEKRIQKKLEKKLKKLEEEDEDEDDREGGDDDHVFVAHLGGWFPRNHPLAQGVGGYPGMMPPWMQPQKQENTLKDLMPLLVAWITKPQERSPLEAILPLLIGKGNLEPKDMLNMLSPFVLKMSEMNAHSTQSLMENMGKMDDAFRKKMLDLLMSDPSRTPDEIEKWQRWLNFGETALRKGAAVVRDALKDGDGKTPKRIENKKPAHALPGPKKEGDAAQEGGGNKPATETTEESSTPASDPRGDAEKLKRARVEQFLLATEEEMLAESDPVLMAGKTEEIWLVLPSSLRRKIEEAVQDDPIQDEKLILVFTTLKEICPDITNRIGEALMEDPEKQEWMKVYLEACAFPEEDEDEEDEEEDGDQAEEDGAEEKEEPAIDKE